MIEKRELHIEAAKVLMNQHLNGSRFDSLPQKIEPKNEHDAYAIQSELFKLRKENLGDLVGYKVALTSEVMQNMLRFPSPFSGPLHRNLIYTDGKDLNRKDYGRLCIECEIAAVLKTDLPKKNYLYTQEDIGKAIDTIAPALEVVDDRHADYDEIHSKVLTLIADNAWNAGVIHGRMRKDWHDLDLGKITGEVTVDGHTTGKGIGTDVLGHPFNALAWLANKVISQGQEIKAGMLVMTGTMIKTQFVQKGERLNFTIPELGSVTIEVN